MRLKKTGSGLPQLSPAAADDILVNILDGLDYEPNTISLKDLTEYCNYRKERYLLQKAAVILMLVIFALLPFFFIAPQMTVTLMDEDPYDPLYQIEVDSFLPVRKVTATLVNYDIPVYDKGDGVYTFEPTENGDITVSVLLINGQERSQVIRSTGVDKQAPTAISTKTEYGMVYVYLEDNATGIDYSTLRAETGDGKKIEDIYYNEADGIVSFRYPSDSVTLYVADKAGNTLQLNMKMQDIS